MQKHKDRLKQLNIKTFESLIEKSPSEAYPNNELLLKQRILRALTCMQINYILYTYFYLLEKCTKTKLQDIKFGIIGCGAIGRLILNSLIILSKQGLNTSNITISTRQPEHLQIYNKHFNVGLTFDNERVMQQSDVVFIATPATLDNWILVDLRESYEKRCAKAGVRPLVYILTTNIDQKKCLTSLNSAHILLPTINYASIEEFMNTHTWYKTSETPQRQQLLEDFLYKKLLGNLPGIYNTMCYVFLNWEMAIKTEQQMDPSVHPEMHAAFRKPSTEQCYKLRCKRWKSALMNFCQG